MSRWTHDADGRRRDGAPDDAVLAPLDGRAGPARRLAPAVSAEMVRAVLERALEAPVELVSDPPPPPRASRPWRRALALAAGVLLAVSVGSGASAVALRLVDIELGQPELAPEPPPPPRAERHPVPAPPPREPAPEVEVPAETVAPQPAPAARPQRRRKVRVVIESPPPAPAAAPARAPQTVVPENLPPADLLAFANDRRARGAWRDADQFYRAAMSRFPGTDAAVVAAVASASLHLQHLGDPAGALDGYRRTLDAWPSGAVAEEARWGVAEAQRALGRGDAEARALREFLQHHPSSALAPAAERRLRRLGQ